MEDILKNKTAVVYGAGSIGGAVAAAFAKAGATVFVADHHEDTLKKLADQQIQTERLDVLWQRAIQAGAEVFHSLEDAFWGDRHGQIIDPFGHRWGLAQHVRDVPPEEVARLAAQVFDQGEGEKS